MSPVLVEDKKMAEPGSSSQERLIERIRGLKKTRNAIIVAHNYQIGEIQDVADLCADSLELVIET